MKKFIALLFGLIIVILMVGCLNLEGFFPFLNKAPVIISKPIITATEDQLYSYQVEASDPNGDTLTYSFTIKPEGMDIDSENGLIIWTPTNDQVGIQQVVVEISDGKQSITQSFEIEVVNVNNPPQILSRFPIDLNMGINEGDSIKFEVQAHDIDLNTVLSYQWLLNGKKVSSSTVSGNDSKSSWIYSASYGDYSQKIVKVLVSDGELEDYKQWNIAINDTSPPTQPILNTITSPTNISPQILSGTKEANTSIWINGTEVVPLDPSTDWSYSYNLSEGINNISITSRDAADNESSTVTTIIEYDPNIYVNAGNTSGIEDGTKTYPFNTITEGIDAVAPGKSVMVAVGTYHEQLIINKEITLQGASQDNTLITGSGLTENLISLEADNITITGFTIDGNSSTSVGIYFDNYSSININDNLIKNNKDYGISYINSAPIIEGNNIENNSSSGIKVATNGAGIIRNNSIVSNQHGIRTYGDSCPEINRNNISNNNIGIYCRESATPIVSYNTINNNSGYGILIDNTFGNSVNPDIGGVEGESDGKNNITGNHIHGVSNETTHSIMALNNWWGDDDGPKYPNNPDGNADLLSDWVFWNDVNYEDRSIKFDPYLREPQTL
jgi:parallel beta-helix repeat protein